MGNKHIAESLIEVNKQISSTIDKLDKEKVSGLERQNLINDLNTVIRQLDHVVEEIEKST